MVTQNTNPFALPGFGQSGEMATNPMLASMEMMRKAWEGLAGASGFDQSLAVPGTSAQDLEKRIADLRAVENWLRMNLSMLSSTIQALDVQRSTMATLQAFVASAGGGAGAATATPSPLDVVLGIRRGADVAPSADSSGLFDGTATKPVDTASVPVQRGGAGTAASDNTATADRNPGAGAATAPSSDDAAATSPAVNTMMQSWWDMLQTQFDNLASAATATLQNAEAMQDAATEAQKKAVEKTREAAQALAKATPAGTAVARKTAAKKTAAKKAVARTASAKKTTAKKAASRKSASRTAGGATSSRAATTAAVTQAEVPKPATKKVATAKKAAAKTTVARKSPAKKSAAKKTAGTGS